MNINSKASAESRSVPCLQAGPDESPNGRWRKSQVVVFIKAMITSARAELVLQLSSVSTSAAATGTKQMNQDDLLDMSNHQQIPYLS